MTFESQNTLRAREFAIKSGDVHLNNAGCAPMTLQAAAAIRRIVHQSTEEAYFARELMYKESALARRIFGQVLGVGSQQVSMMPNCSTAVSMLAFGLHLERGQVVLTIDQEYPSNVYAWHRACEMRGARIKVFKSEPDLQVNWAQFIDEIRPGVRVVVLSWVQSRSGCKAPLTVIAEACRRVDALLAVDATQGLGVIPFELGSYGVDFVVGATHKFLCGPVGHGYLAFREGIEDSLQPIIVGAMTYGHPDDDTDPSRKPRTGVARYEPGAPLLYGTIGTAASIQALTGFGIGQIELVAMGLRKHLACALADLGFKVMGASPDNLTDSGPIVTIDAAHRIESICAELTNRRISFFRKGNLLRFSPHGFNSSEEIEAVLDAFKSILLK